jgi:hypothetical protein
MARFTFEVGNGKKPRKIVVSGQPDAKAAEAHLKAQLPKDTPIKLEGNNGQVAGKGEDAKG